MGQGNVVGAESAANATRMVRACPGHLRKSRVVGGVVIGPTSVVFFCDDRL